MIMVWNQLQTEQENIYIQLKKLERLQLKAMTLNAQIGKTEHEIKVYTEQLNRIKEKLEKLESFSFINYYRNWTGKQDELREEETGKAAALELKINEAKLMKQDLLNDLQNINQEIIQFNEEQLKRQLEMVIIKKENWIKENQPEKAQQLQYLAESELNCKNLLIEIEEAKSAGEEALNQLHYALDSLQTASSYSTWDTFLGGGLLATHLKHEKLDESESKIHNAQIALQRFKNELLDVEELDAKNLEVTTDGFVKFADYFFDDIFSAWSIHSKISSSKEQITRITGNVRNTLNKLKRKQEVVEKEQIAIPEKKNDILGLEK
jgi:hypothetical protein